MKINITKKQYRDLLLSVIIGTYVRESVDEMQGKDNRNVRDLENYLLSLAKDFDSEDMIEDLGGSALIPSPKVCKEYHDNYIDEFEDDAFWSKLERDLGQRDFYRTITEEERKEMKENDGWLPERIHEIYKKYEEEFEENGVKNLEILNSRTKQLSPKFEKWHKLKNRLCEKAGEKFFHEREIWWCSVGENIGFEQNGKGDKFSRPVVVLKKFNLDVCLTVPLTTSTKTGKYYFPVGEVEQEKASAILSQVRLIDKKRFFKKTGTMEESTFNCLIDAVVSVNFKKTKD